MAVAGAGILLLIVMSLSSTLAIAAGGNSGAAILWMMRVVTGCAINVFSGSLIGVIYYEIFFIKEGHAPGALASVFD